MNGGIPRTKMFSVNTRMEKQKWWKIYKPKLLSTTALIYLQSMPDKTGMGCLRQEWENTNDKNKRSSSSKKCFVSSLV